MFRLHPRFHFECWTACEMSSTFQTSCVSTTAPTAPGDPLDQHFLATKVDRWFSVQSQRLRKTFIYRQFTNTLGIWTGGPLHEHKAPSSNYTVQKLSFSVEVLVLNWRLCARISPTRLFVWPWPKDGNRRGRRLSFGCSKMFNHSWLALIVAEGLLSFNNTFSSRHAVYRSPSSFNQ